MSMHELDRVRSDVELDGIRWDGDDVILTLSRKSPKDALIPSVVLRCVRTTDLEISLDMEGQVATVR